MPLPALTERTMGGTAKVTVDGRRYEMDASGNLLEGCLSHGLNLPYFCWHPSLGSVGACRQCAVVRYRDDDDDRGTLVMACMTPAADGDRISIEDEQARTLRARVIESLMINHPHDCPVCEEGGECHLQDMTVMSGHNYRRYDKRKRTHRNQHLGPFINHEMNRCIACHRCVRYYADYAGGTDLAAQAAHHHVYYGRFEDGPLESEFSGNLVEVCPTGVFTDRVFSSRYARKWDLRTAPSVCVGCAVGCNTAPGERGGVLRRIVNRYHSEVNGHFLCDRGRFGFDFVNSPERLAAPVRRGGGEETPLGAAETAALPARWRERGAVGIGSPRAGMEANFALRELVGAENFYSGAGLAEQEAVRLALALSRDAAFRCPSLRGIEQADAVLVLGEDVTNTAPRVALALRQAVRNRALRMAAERGIPAWQDAAVRDLAQDARSPLIILSPHATRLDDAASETLIAGPAELARTGFAVAAAIAGGEGPEEVRAIADALAGASRPLVVAGSGAGRPELVQAAADVARALARRSGEPAGLCLLAPEVNSMGHEMLRPRDNTLRAALERMAAGGAAEVVVLENDLYRRADAASVDRALARVERLTVIDQLPTRTTGRADVVLPAAAFSEQDATWVNYEGRAQHALQVHPPRGGALPAWRWLGETDGPGLLRRCAAAAPELKGLAAAAPVPPAAGMKTPRQPHRCSGRTAEAAHLDVHEPWRPEDPRSPMSFSMEGAPPDAPGGVLAAAWAPGWNSNQAVAKFQREVNGPLKRDRPGVLLCERSAEGAFFDAPPPPAASKGLEPVLEHRIFGGDELSARSPAVRGRMTEEAWLGLAPADAERLGLAAGDEAELAGGAARVRIRSEMKPGTAAVYCGDGRISPHALGDAVTPRRREAAPPASADEGDGP